MLANDRRMHWMLAVGKSCRNYVRPLIILYQYHYDVCIFICLILQSLFYV